ncbi:MAG: DsbA family protein [Candidatus Thiodiazotropha sp. (ex Gloverina cf. vestifex)]|nr:DsbA family protein [Candidatus Thiodiazotropha sp. (ex Gloverina cf. vestifex)]
MAHLVYIHDPMCSWCWAFRPVLNDLLQRLPEGMTHSRLLGGLAPDTDQPMPDEMQHTLQKTWRRIQKKLPDTRFNFDFWSLNSPRRSTYPACRAVLSARTLDPTKEDAMTLAIQQAYYLHARNPSDDTTLIGLADEIGLNSTAFKEIFHSPSTRHQLESEIAQATRMGVHSFPSLILQHEKSTWPVAVDYHAADNMLETIELILD